LLTTTARGSEIIQPVCIQCIVSDEHFPSLPCSQYEFNQAKKQSLSSPHTIFKIKFNRQYVQHFVWYHRTGSSKLTKHHLSRLPFSILWITSFFSSVASLLSSPASHSSGSAISHAVKVSTVYTATNKVWIIWIAMFQLVLKTRYHHNVSYQTEASLSRHMPFQMLSYIIFCLVFFLFLYWFFLDSSFKVSPKY
jgi:hypothetical protein